MPPPSPIPSFWASESFLMSQLFPSGGQSIGASASVLPMNIQDWFPLGLTVLISLLSKELSRVFSSTTIQKYQFFGTLPSLWSNSHIHTWLVENHSFDYMNLCWQKVMSLIFITLSRFVIALLPRSIYILNRDHVSSVQSLSRVQLFATPWIAER